MVVSTTTSRTRADMGSMSRRRTNSSVTGAVLWLVVLCCSVLHHGGHNSHQEAFRSTFWPPGASAEFVDAIMLAASAASASASFPAGLTATYDTSNNFSTHTYDWSNGRWTAPDKQQQWWEGRRPPDHQRIDLYLNEDWSGAQAGWGDFPQQPYSTPFYPISDPTLRRSGTQPNNEEFIPTGAPLHWRGQNPRWLTADPLFFSYEDLSADSIRMAGVPTKGSQQCRTAFELASFCQGSVPVYVPEALAHPLQPDGLNLTVGSPDSYLTRPDWLGWQWDDENQASDLPYNHTCILALRDVIPPLSETGIRFFWNNTACGTSWRHRPFDTQVDDLGQLVYHDADNTIWPNASVRSYQALDLYITKDKANDAVPYYFAPYWFRPLLYGNYDYYTNEYMVDDYRDKLYSDYYNGGNKLDFQPPCTRPVLEGVTCTLSLSPAPPDVWREDRTCAQSIPDGVPIIVCRDTNQNFRRLEGIGTHHDPPVAVPKLRYKTPAKYVDEGSYSTPQGLLPNVACNRATWSKRFGGRCATPVVQYLAYDEAYYTPSASQAYTIPEYGGCIDGGHMRFIANLAKDGSWEHWDNPTYRGWFIPPMWPLTVWRAAASSSDTNAWPKSLYQPWARAEDEGPNPGVNTNQAELDSLFMHQKVFELPATSPSSGCTRIRFQHRSQGLKCLTAPSSLTTANNIGWNQNNISVSTNCDNSRSQQCFQIEGSLATGARIMHRGLCIGADPSDPLPAPNQAAVVINLRPCDEGWVLWQRVPEGYFKPAGCSFDQKDNQCAYAWSAYGNTWLQLYNTKAPQARSFLTLFGVFSISNDSPAWESYSILRSFWLDSFASSGVDIRAHRIRFVPPGARQGLNTRGAGLNQGCGGNLKLWIDSNRREMVENCHYNTGVTLGGITFADRDSCMSKFLATQNTNGTRAPVCWSGTTWMYQHANKCDKMSSDYRYSMRQPGGATADKCRSRVGGQYVAVDDLWSFMASDRHDPCGWPFLECVPNCSLPSNPSVKDWVAKSDGYVYTRTDDKGVGCLNAGCTGDSQKLRDPKLANKIAAIDWRNMTLYSANLNFTAFRTKDRFGVSAGEKVWYLNLNFNMLGGDLSGLAELPEIFPNLVHLGLAHCSAGKYAPQYAWQQTQPEMCNALDANGVFVNNTACYCPEDSWNNMTIVPNVGAAIKEYAAKGTLSKTIMRGVTRMFYGSIPQSWGMKNATTPAAWSQTLMSVNLAGHHKLYGELPKAWYDQTIFPKLFYLKLKGTKIRADMTRLQWIDTVTCSGVDWGRKDGEPGSAGDWVQTCTSTPGGSCEKCDWWPARSAAPWYYDAAAKPLTCGDFIPDGAGYQSFPCDTASNYHLNTSALTVLDPNADKCCQFQATCSITAPGGGRFRCTSPGMIFDDSKLNSAPADSATCCKPFVPTCGVADMDGRPFVCPTDGVKYNLVNATATDPSVAVCCEFVPTCGAIYPNETKYTCTASGYILDPSTLSEGALDTPPTDDLCCTKANCAPSAAGFHPGVHYSCSGGECCFYPVCGAIPQLSEDATVTDPVTGQLTVNTSRIANVTAYDCPANLGYMTNTSAVNSTYVSLRSCCFRLTCGSSDSTGTPYACPPTNSRNPSQLQEPLTNDPAIDVETCCYQPTCGANSYTGVPYQCPLGAYIYNDNSTALTNPTTAKCCVEIFPDLVLSQSVSPPGGLILIGDSANITVTITNQGQGHGVDLLRNQTLPDGLVYDITTPPEGCAYANNQTMSCTPTASLVMSATRSYLVTVKAVAVGSFAVSSSVSEPRDSNVTNHEPVQSTITVGHTCQQYNSDKSRYDCGPMFEFNTASASDTNPNKAQCCTEVFPDLVLSQSVSPAGGSVLIGDSVNITVTITNQGQWQGVNITTNMTQLPDGLVYDTTTPPEGCLYPNNQTMSCTPIASLAVSASRSYLVTVKAVAVGSFAVSSSVSESRDSDAANNGPVQSTITVGHTCQQYNSDKSRYDCGPMFEFNTASASNTNPDKAHCCTEVFPDVVLGQSVSPAGGSVLVGDSVNITVTITNQGQWQGVNVTTNMTQLPDGLVYDTTTPPEGCSFPDAKTLDCSPVTSFAVSATRSYLVTVKAVAAGSYNVSASVSETRDSNLANNGPVQSSITVGRTCQQYNSDKSSFACSPGYDFVPAQGSNPSPSNSNCCEYVPVCGGLWENGTVHQCPVGYQLISSRLSTRNPDDATCCEYVPVCGAFWANGTAYQCPSGTELTAANVNNTAPSDATCCHDINGCAAAPCDSITHAVDGVCTDIPAPGSGFVCSCDSGYSWNVTDNICTDNCLFGTDVATWCNGHGNGSCTGGICGCLAAYDGDRCQFDKDGCYASPCNITANAVNGSCADLVAPLSGYTCNCTIGYIWDAGTASCQNFNACSSNPCSNTAYAVNTSCADLPPPSIDYSCSCATGYSWNSSTLECQDTAGCAGDPCDGTDNTVLGSCADVTAPGTDYTCDCDPGYIWNAANLTCIDFNACSSNPCSNTSHADNTSCADLPPPSEYYSCSCETGYSWNSSTLECEDFNACSSNPCSITTHADNTSCVDLPPPSTDHSCNCTTGYSWNNITLDCQDTNGCAGAPCDNTPHAHVNTCSDVPAPGTGYMCSCDSGFYWQSTNLSCVEVNGCSNSPCDFINNTTPGSCADLPPPSTAFTCNCSTGYSWSSTNLNCTDTAGCAGDPCDGTGNTILGSCTDVTAPGTDYTCDCDPGYIWNAANLTCIDFNACSSNPCSSTTHADNTSCVDLPPPSVDYSCSCATGYSWNNITLQCQDTNGCAGAPCDNTPHAQANTCSDVAAPGVGYVCTCDSGFYWQSTNLSCSEVNGCSNSPCDFINNTTPGSCADLPPPSTAFTCNCSTGYSWNSTNLNCTDIDGCAGSPCDGTGNTILGSCTDVTAPGTDYTCDCDPGYVWNAANLTCIGFNACSSNPCSTKAHAVTTSCADLPPPSIDYSCSCTTGYTWNNITLECQDTDECAAAPCDNELHAMTGICSDVPAPGTGYICSCDSGFYWQSTNLSCSEVNGCSNSPCDFISSAAPGSCADLPPPSTAFTCNCSTGYSWNSTNLNCTDTYGCAGSPCDGTGNTIFGSCADVTAPGTDYTCDCDTGYVWNAANLTCIDFNACSSNPCSSTTHADNTSCVDLPPPSADYSCSCATGYSWNNDTLECQDDCVYRTDMAAFCNGHGNGSCTAGVCGCQPAYEGLRCEGDVNGCIADPCNGLPHTVNDSCVDNAAPATGHSCNCSAGYSWDQAAQKCRDSCLVVPNYCNNHETSCSQGICTCSAGWEGTHCDIDVIGCAGNPCDVIPNAVNGTCTDIPAPGTGFNCTCQQAYTWDAASFRCRYVPRCGGLVEAGIPYDCPAHYEYDPAAANVTNVNDTMCCRFVPTCGYYREDGTRFQCPVGRVFNHASASSTSPDNSTCCRLPYQGACPTLDLRPVLYSPSATSVDSIPILVVFPAQESWAAYCPSRLAPGGQQANMCNLKLLRISMFSDPGLVPEGVNSTAPPDGDGSFFQLSFSCLNVSSLSCQLQFDPHADGRWSIQMLPAMQTTEMCDQQVSLLPSITELVIDTLPPVLVNMIVNKQPTADVHDFEVCATFSEPILWVADTLLQSSPSNSNSNTIPDSSSAGVPQAQATAVPAAPTVFSSSGILLTNALLLNISVTPKAVAILNDGSSSGAASQYCMWLRTWGGATAEVKVIGAAYQDLAGNTGQQSQVVQVTAPGSDLWQQASDLAATATAISATASALGATAAAASATGAGGATSILRSVGHTQFLAMSVSLAVPWLPAEYVKLCAGLEWSNLVKPAENVVKVTSNATSLIREQLPATSQRRLASAAPTTSESSSRRCTADPESGECTGSVTDDKQKNGREWSLMHAVRELHNKQQQYMEQHKSSSTNLIFHNAHHQRPPAKSVGPPARQLLSLGDFSIAVQDTSSSSTEHRHPIRQVQEQQDAVVDSWLAGNQHIGSYQASSTAGSSSSGVNLSGASSFSSSNSSRTNSTTFIAAGVSRQPEQFSLHELRMSILTLAVAVVAASVVQWLLLGIWKLCRLDPKNLPTLLVFPKLQVFVYSLLMVPIMYGASKLISHTPSLATSEAAAGIACVVLLPLPVLAFWIYIIWMWHQQLHSKPAIAARRTQSHFTRTYKSPESEDSSAVAAAAVLSNMDDHGAAAARSGATLALIGSPDDNPTLIIRNKKTGDEDLDLCMDDPISSSPDSEIDPTSGYTGSRPAGNHQAPNPSAGVYGQGSSRPWRGLHSQDGDKKRSEGGESQSVSSSAAAARGSGSDGSGAAAVAQGPKAVAEGTEDSAELDEDHATAMAAAWNAARSAGTTSNGGGWGSAAGAAAAEPMLSSGGINVGAQQQQQRSAHGGLSKRQEVWGDAEPGSPDAGAAAEAGQPLAAAAAAAFLDRYWFLVDDLVGDDKTAAAARVRVSVLMFYIVSTLQRCLTALFFGLYHFKYVSVLQLAVLIAVHAAFVMYLVTARPYASNIMLVADVVAYTCELTILGAAVVLKQSPGNQKLFAVLVTCYFVDVAIMLVPELVRLVLMAYTWLKRRAQNSRAQAAAAAATEDDDSADDAVIAAVGVEGRPTGHKQPRKSQTKQQQQQQQQQQQEQRQDDIPAAVAAMGVAAPRASNVRGIAGAAAAATAALSLSENGGKR